MTEQKYQDEALLTTGVFLSVTIKLNPKKV